MRLLHVTVAMPKHSLLICHAEKQRRTSNVTENINKCNINMCCLALCMEPSVLWKCHDVVVRKYIYILNGESKKKVTHYVESRLCRNHIHSLHLCEYNILSFPFTWLVAWLFLHTIATIIHFFCCFALDKRALRSQIHCIVVCLIL